MSELNDASIGVRVHSLAKDIRRRILTSSEPAPDVLYHYTDAAGLLGILKEKQLWATNVYNLNDSYELRYGLELISHIVDLQIKKTDNKHLIDFLNDSKIILNLHRHSFDVFVVCLCQKDNLLSQWRAYGARGAGYSIGIRSNFFETSTESPLSVRTQTRLKKVEYSRSEQERVATKIIQPFCQLVTDLVEGADKDRASLVRQRSANCLAGELLELVYCFKSPAFEEEAEWRVVHTVYNDYPSERLRFRAKGGSIVPYVELDFVPTIKESGSGYPITSIRFGPTLDPKLTEVSLISLLESYFGPYNSIRPLSSDIPLRNAVP